MIKVKMSILFEEDNFFYETEATSSIEFTKPNNVFENSISKDTTSLQGIFLKNEDQKTENWTNEKEKVIDRIEKEAVSVLDVAEYILQKLSTMTTMKLQKLVYYCQAWSLVWDEKPLFYENIEAWANGPVVRKLYNYHRGFFKISKILTGNPDLLNEHQKATIDAVNSYYGNKTSQWLSDLTHMENPWLFTRNGLPDNARGNRVIKLNVIAEYYGSLTDNPD